MSSRGIRQSGFTLLEVLIAVVVLAFGLLGIVAVFPAVIDVQRRAQDAVIGGSLAASAEAYLSASVLDAATLDWFDWEADGAPMIRRFPSKEVLSNDPTISAQQLLVFPDGVEGVDLDFLWDSVEIDADGTLVFGGENAAVPFRFAADGTPQPMSQQQLPSIEFPVGVRLLPDEASGASPRYVWDVVVRRVDTGIGQELEEGRISVGLPLSRLPELPIEFAIFVRPIDRGIRVPAGLTLRDTLRGYRLERLDGTGPLTRDDLEDRDRRFPVAAFDSDATDPRPGASLEGRDRAQYSVPVAIPRGRRLSDVFTASGGTRLDVTRDISIRRSLTGPQFTLPSARRALAQVGQLFVDDFGIVHRVTRVFEPEPGDEGLPRLIEISPPLSPTFRQIVLTPQVPADIRVVRTR